MEDVVPVVLLVGFRTLDPAAGRVGGLLNPPPAVRLTVELVGFVVEEVVPGRLAVAVVDPGLLGGIISFLASATLLALGSSF